MKKFQQGEFEEIVTLTIGISFKEAYGGMKKKLKQSFRDGDMHSSDLQTIG